MATAQATNSAPIPVDFDYWALKIQVRDIEWSSLRGAWMAHLVDHETHIKGAMEVCIDCVTVHKYFYCDKAHVKRFEPCNVNRSVYHPSYIAKHEELEPNNEYVRQALNRTPPRKLVATPPLGISIWRGYNPEIKLHRRHVDGCFQGASPEYIIQGGGGLGHSIYYRRCDGEFRNLVHQVLEMGETRDEVTVQRSLEADQDAKEDRGATLTLATRGFKRTTTTTTTNNPSISGRAPEVTENENHNRKWGN